MKKFNFKLSKELLLLLFFIIFISVNYTFYSKIFTAINKEKVKLVKELTELHSGVNKEISTFEGNLDIFNKIKSAREILIEKEYEINYLKSKIRDKKDVLSVLKTLMLESKIGINKIELTSDTVTDRVGLLTFSCSGKVRLEEFIEFLDMVDGKNDILIVESYNIKPNRESEFWNLEIIIKSLSLVLPT